MYYDHARKALVDSETGAIIPVEDGDDLRSIVPEIPGDNHSSPAGLREYHPTSQQDINIPVEYYFEEFSTMNERNNNGNNQNNANANRDWTLAQALQAMEFEIANDSVDDPNRNMHDDFRQKEYRASKWKRQMFTISTLICISQIVILAVMIQLNGFASQSENPMFGPNAFTLIVFGAKYDYLIVKKGQWWRLITPIFLHAGIVHLISNVLIQLRIGGYLNQVFGTAKWLTIYLVSGVFGNIASACLLPDSIGVGSSGAVLGMLTAWIVWIIFRWNKIPERCRPQRNCQLVVVLVSVGVTLGMSFTPYVDWAAHFGGALQGLLWSLALLSEELDISNQHKNILRIFAISVSIATFIYGLYYLSVVVKIINLNE